ncbi:MAG: hypothetical protein V4534_01290 [Myxococcota bacterium]
MPFIFLLIAILFAPVEIRAHLEHEIFHLAGCESLEEEEAEEKSSKGRDRDFFWWGLPV